MLTALTLLLCAAEPPPRNVYVGAYLSDVSDFDLKAGRFKADLTVWVKWLGDGADVPEVTFENGEIDSRAELGRENDAAWHSVRWRVQGTFRGEFPLHAFPFDEQTLPVVFGLDERAGRLVPDLGASGMSERFSITGWAYEPYFTARTDERIFGSDLGSVAHEGQNSRRRRSVFAVEMQRPFGPYLIKFALPLVLILLMALLALFLPAERLDVRSALGITALLACIAFHYTQADTLPDVTYLVAADMLFLAAYVLISGTLVLSVVAFRLVERHPGAAHRADVLGLWGLPVVTAVAVSVLISNASPPGPLMPVVVAPAPRPTLPLLRVGVPGLVAPGVRAPLVMRQADGTLAAMLVEEAPALTNALVRLLPDGGMRVRWRLKAGAAWSDGNAVTSADLEFSLSLVPRSQHLSAVRVDERTLDVTYPARHSEYLEGFEVWPQAGARALAGAGDAAPEHEAAAGRLPVAGPYVVSQFDVGRRSMLGRNPGFAGPRALFEKVEVSVVDPLAGARALLKDELDVLPELTPESYQLLRAAPTVRVLEQPGELLWVLVPKLSSAPWSSLPLRQSALAALNRQALVTALEPSPTRVAWGWRPSKAFPLVSDPTVSLKGLAVTLNVMPMAPGQTHTVLARQVVADLSKAGATVELVERADLDEAVRRGDFEGLALVRRETRDPGSFMNVPRLDAAVEPYFDDEMVERYDAWVSSLYVERRAFLEQAMQEAWFLRLPMLPLVLTSRLSAVRAELTGPEWGAAESLWWNVSDWQR